MFQSITWIGSFLLIVVLCHGQPQDLNRLHRVKRIVGGSPPDNIDHYSYVASIQSLERGKLKHICGATYLKNGWVLTAAHCMVGKNWRNFYIKLGGENLSTINRSNIYKVLEVQKTNYLPIFMVNDIALLRIDLKDSTPPSSSIKLPESNYNLRPGLTCEIGGFGSTAFSEPVSDSFRVASIQIVPLLTCIKTLGFIVMPSVRGSVICAGGGKTDTCQGDSGTALICDGIIAGITSYGRDCGVEGVPAIYTNVSHYSPWILRTIRR